jgi:hypothetical protein
MWSKPMVENLLRDWLAKPHTCARGGIGYSWRKWERTHQCVVSIHPNAMGWSDPATFKLFADFRDLGWGLTVKQAEWARPGVKEVVLIPPPERRQRDMDRPKPILTHADLGTQEPGDPQLRGYDPGHPWYYLLGGRPLRPEEIEPDREWDLPSDTRLERVKDHIKRKKRLEELRGDYKRRLQQDIERYSEVTSPGYELSAFDRNLGYGLETSIYLCHNHVWASKAWLAAIERELAKYQAPPSRMTLTPEWSSTPIKQPTEQLRLF